MFMSYAKNMSQTSGSTARSSPKLPSNAPGSKSPSQTRLTGLSPPPSESVEPIAPAAGLPMGARASASPARPAQPDNAPAPAPMESTVVGMATREEPKPLIKSSGTNLLLDFIAKTDNGPRTSYVPANQGVSNPPAPPPAEIRRSGVEFPQRLTFAGEDRRFDPKNFPMRGEEENSRPLGSTANQLQLFVGQLQRESLGRAQRQSREGFEPFLNAFLYKVEILRLSRIGLAENKPDELDELQRTLDRVFRDLSEVRGENEAMRSELGILLRNFQPNLNPSPDPRLLEKESENLALREQLLALKEQNAQSRSSSKKRKKSVPATQNFLVPETQGGYFEQPPSLYDGGPGPMYTPPVLPPLPPPSTSTTTTLHYISPTPSAPSSVQGSLRTTHVIPSPRHSYIASPRHSYLASGDRGVKVVQVTTEGGSSISTTSGTPWRVETSTGSSLAGRQTFVQGSETILMPNRQTVIQSPETIYLPGRQTVVQGSETIYMPGRQTVIQGPQTTLIPSPRQTIVFPSDSAPGTPTVRSLRQTAIFPPEASVIPNVIPSAQHTSLYGQGQPTTIVRQTISPPPEPSNSAQLHPSTWSFAQSPNHSPRPSASNLGPITIVNGVPTLPPIYVKLPPSSAPNQPLMSVSQLTPSVTSQQSLSSQKEVPIYPQKPISVEEFNRLIANNQQNQASAPAIRSREELERNSEFLQSSKPGQRTTFVNAYPQGYSPSHQTTTVIRHSYPNPESQKPESTPSTPFDKQVADLGPLVTHKIPLSQETKTSPTSETGPLGSESLNNKEQFRKQTPYTLLKPNLDPNEDTNNLSSNSVNRNYLLDPTDKFTWDPKKEVNNLPSNSLTEEQKKSATQNMVPRAARESEALSSESPIDSRDALGRPSQKTTNLPGQNQKPTPDINIFIRPENYISIPGGSGFEKLPSKTPQENFDPDIFPSAEGKAKLKPEDFDGVPLPNHWPDEKPKENIRDNFEPEEKKPTYLSDFQPKKQNLATNDFWMFKHPSSRRETDVSLPELNSYPREDTSEPLDSRPNGSTPIPLAPDLLRDSFSAVPSGDNRAFFTKNSAAQPLRAPFDHRSFGQEATSNNKGSAYAGTTQAPRMSANDPDKTDFAPRKLSPDNPNNAISENFYRPSRSPGPNNTGENWAGQIGFDRKSDNDRPSPSFREHTVQGSANPNVGYPNRNNYDDQFNRNGTYRNNTGNIGGIDPKMVRSSSSMISDNRKPNTNFGHLSNETTSNLRELQDILKKNSSKDTDGFRRDPGLETSHSYFSSLNSQNKTGQVSYVKETLGEQSFMNFATFRNGNDYSSRMNTPSSYASKSQAPIGRSVLGSNLIEEIRKARDKVNVMNQQLSEQVSKVNNRAY